MTPRPSVKQGGEWYHYDTIEGRGEVPCDPQGAGRRAALGIFSEAVWVQGTVSPSPPTREHDLNYVLSKLTALWEEVERLRHDLADHRHGYPPHDQVTQEVETLQHEKLVHSKQSPHEGHNDHHDPNALHQDTHHHGHDHTDDTHDHEGHDHSQDHSEHGEGHDHSGDTHDHEGHDHSKDTHQHDNDHHHDHDHTGDTHEHEGHDHSQDHTEHGEGHDHTGDVHNHEGHDHRQDAHQHDHDHHHHDDHHHHHHEKDAHDTHGLHDTPEEAPAPASEAVRGATLDGKIQTVIRRQDPRMTLLCDVDCMTLLVGEQRRADLGWSVLMARHCWQSGQCSFRGFLTPYPSQHPPGNRSTPKLYLNLS
ncbi:uncharacterized protein E2C01_028182 [Portunus trituberculatus]|uniref:Uncharacterized protein n=1 Tax=Portunus trituberculatus TaxID=210409 RepID=A0A5B7EJZ7_PORTR|nr:uncharacterized protein [Portunus trituberculatus]